MTLASPSPAWLALQLGELLASRPSHLTAAHRKALDFAANVHRTAGTGLDLALMCDSFTRPAPVDGPGAVSASHPETSRAAAESVAQSAKMERLRVLASVIEDGPASASVIADRLGLVPNQVAARAWELRKPKGGGAPWLEWRYEWPLTKRFYTDTTPHGRQGNMLFLADAGRDELVREHGSLEVAAKLLREGRTS